MTENNQWMTYGLLAVAAVALAIVAYSMLGATAPATGAAWTPAQAQQAFAAQDATNPCIAPPGYTQADWEEHMGHHPEQYAQCLQK